MTKTMLFTYRITTGTRAGRELLADLNRELVRDIVGSDLVEKTCDLRKPEGLAGKMVALLGWLDGLDRHVVADCKRIMAERHIEAVYIEGSNYGRLAREIKKAFPACKVISFFHNVESKFFLDAFRNQSSIRSAAVLIANYIAERFAVRYSDRIVCLNVRDSDLLRKIYGRGATNISPLCIKAPATAKVCPPEHPRAPCAIFVGGAFYANVRGVFWYAKHVAPRLNCMTYIIGKGFDQHRTELELNPNIKVVGEVESVDEWYQRASLVVAPIFDGSGMKTKVAEALCYGRPVVGTSEAFTGYETHASRVGYVCDTEDEFVDRIGQIVSGASSFSPGELRRVYDQSYSVPAARNYMVQALSF